MRYISRSLPFVVRGLSLALIFVMGCENGGPGPTLSRQVQQLTTQKGELQSKLEQTQSENDRLIKQNESLSKIGDKRAEAIYHIKEVKIGRFTNLYDENKDGTKESLIVYVAPIDETGDVVKAAGSAEVQLWDLNSPDASKAIVEQWRVEPNEMKKLWMESLLSSGYRFSFNVGEAAEKFDRDKSTLTVKISFTDYLSGRTFLEQKAIKP